VIPRRVLITGRGSIARRHAAHLRECIPAVQLGIVARGPVDPVLQPCEVFETFEAGMAWKPEGVVIASVSSRHAAELQAVLASGLPCLAEKPLVTSRAELDALRRAPRTAAVQVGCNLRQLPALQRLRAMLAAGALGHLVRAHLEVGQNLEQWRPSRELSSTYSADPGQGGGVVFDLVHEIDMASWLLGPLEVRAALGGRRSSLPLRSDDVHVALLQGEGGLPVTVALDYISARAVRRYALVGDRGTIVCDLIARRMTLEDADGSRTLTAEAAEFDVAGTYRLQMQDWLAAVRNPAHPLRSPLEEGLVSADLMLAMKEAA
jgi:predicted dehydrogenase